MTQSERSRARWLDLLIEVPAVVVTFVMMTQITANAVLRAFFERPIDWTLEVVQYWYMPILAMLGFMAAQRRGQHIAADLLFERLPTPVKRPLLAALFVMGAVLMFGLAWYGWREALHAHELQKHAGISPIPAWPVYFLVPLTFGVMTLQFVGGAIDTAHRGVQPLDQNEADVGSTPAKVGRELT